MHKVILVIEDNKEIREAIKVSLGSLGYTVKLAENGAEALEMLQQDDSLPCLIYLDLMMPIMDGWEFRKNQLESPKLASIPTVIISADGRAKQKALDLKIEKAIVKPIEFNSLLETTISYCG